MDTDCWIIVARLATQSGKLTMPCVFNDAAWLTSRSAPLDPGLECFWRSQALKKRSWETYDHHGMMFHLAVWTGPSLYGFIILLVPIVSQDSIAGIRCGRIVCIVLYFLLILTENLTENVPRLKLSALFKRMCTWAREQMYAYICMYVYIYIYIYIHTHIHTHL
jgi:hypothetical protein